MRHLHTLSVAVAATVAVGLACGCDTNDSRHNPGDGGGPINDGGLVDLASSPTGDGPIVPLDGPGLSTDLSLPSSYDFDGGWHPPDPGMQPAMNGNGGSSIVTGPGADASSPGKFSGAGGAAPTIVYPPDGVVVPPNMNALEFHFIPAAGQTLFKIHFKAPTFTVDVYTSCTAVGGGCVYASDPTFWSALVPYARGTMPVTFTVSGVNGASPGAVGTSAQQTITFAQQDITGGLYYWNTAGTVQRYDFGYPTKPPVAYLTTANTGASVCVGCHVVSRQGDRITAGRDIPAPAPYTVYDVATTTPLAPAGTPIGGSANFASFSPDGNHLLFSDGAKIGWQELYTGSIVNAQVASSGTMPDWSPDGLHMVYAKPSSPPPFGFPNPGVDSASLELLHFNGAGWDTPQTLVPFGGQNNYYPAYAPTGDWVAFNRSPSNANSFGNAAPDQDAGTKPDGELWVVPAAGGTPIRLDTANAPGNCQWAKWAPVLDDYYNGKIMWLTFSSDRAYGLRLATGDRTQLWMIGFDPAKAAAGQDPSLPAFWLPFQDITTGNHIAQWAAQVVRKPCNVPTDCAARETCTMGRCVPL